MTSSLQRTTKDFEGAAVAVADSFFIKGEDLQSGIVKEATNSGYNPEELKRLVEKTNTVATLKMLRSSLDKKAEISLATYDKCYDELFGTMQEKVASTPTTFDLPDLRNSQRMEKVAFVTKEPEVINYVDLDNNLFSVSKGLEELKLQKVATEIAIQDSIDWVISEFSNFYAPDFNKYANEVVAINGPKAVPLLSAVSEYIGTDFSLTKVASIIDDTTELHTKTVDILSGINKLATISKDLKTYESMYDQLSSLVG